MTVLEAMQTHSPASCAADVTRAVNWVAHPGATLEAQAECAAIGLAQATFFGLEPVELATMEAQRHNVQDVALL